MIFKLYSSYILTEYFKYAADTLIDYLHMRENAQKKIGDQWDFTANIRFWYSPVSNVLCT